MTTDLFRLEGECGCAAKVPPGELVRILQGVDLPSSPAVLVGPETLDDAGVFKASDDVCLVQTVDFFPPVARVPYTYGQIAAANALSDVYAMGGDPMTALAVVCFPAKSLPPEVLREMTAGGVDKLREAGVVVLGGHSLVDERPKYGFCITGSVDPRHLMDNAHARPGDVLILTKPLGSGIIIKAAKGGQATEAQEAAANRCMALLNREASRVARELGVQCCTDVTGFGLLGHGLQLARASGVGLELWADQLPTLPGALQLARNGCVTGPARTNRAYVDSATLFDEDVPIESTSILYDPQTSGGLLMACPRASAGQLLERVADAQPLAAAVIGRVVEPEQSVETIRVRPSFVFDPKSGYCHPATG